MQRLDFKLLIMLQPVFYDYRRHVVNGISANIPVHLISHLKTSPPNCSYVNISSRNTLNWLRAVLSAFISFRGKKIIFIPAYTTHSGIVASAFLAWLLGIPILVHGQALFKKTNPSFVDFLIASFWLSLSRTYIVYSTIGLDGPFSWPFLRKKVVVIPNRFESIQSLGLREYLPNFSSFNGLPSTLRLLFIGRNRPDSRLDLAVSAVRFLSSQGFYIHLDVVGPTLTSDELVTYHGPQFAEEIITIASFSHVGIYPGAAGLSILHYMALGLCPLVHGDIRSHSGPEPSYIQDGVSGLFFVKDSLTSLTAMLRKLSLDPSLLSVLRRNAFSKAQSLHENSYSYEIYSVIKKT